MYRRKDFLTLLLSDSNKVSIKRLATFLAIIHFFLFSFIAIFTKRDFFNQELLKKVLDIDFYIMGIGLGVITATNIAQVIISRFTDPKTNQDATKEPFEPGPDDNKDTGQ